MPYLAEEAGATLIKKRMKKKPPRWAHRMAIHLLRKGKKEEGDLSYEK